MQLLTLEEVQSLSQNELDNLLIELCENKASIEDIEFITTSANLSKRADIFAQDCIAFNICIYSGYLEAIQFFLTSEKLEQHIDIHNDDDYAFSLAAEKGYINLVKYLLTSPELKQHSNPYANNHAGFRKACSHKQTEIIEFLCSIPEIYKPDFLSGMMEVCETNNVELLEYMLSLFKKLEQNFDITGNNNQVWKCAINTKSIHILHYLYEIEEVKTSLLHFSNSGLDSFPDKDDGFISVDSNVYLVDTEPESYEKTIGFLINLPQIKTLLNDINAMKQTFVSACQKNNIFLINYLFTHFNQSLEESFFNENFSIMSDEVKDMVGKYISFKKLNNNLIDKPSNSIQSIKI